MREFIGSECEEVEGKDIEVEGEASPDEGAFSIDDPEEAEPEGIDGEAEGIGGEAEIVKARGVKRRGESIDEATIAKFANKKSQELHLRGLVVTFLKGQIQQMQADNRSVNFSWLHEVLVTRVQSLKDMGIELTMGIAIKYTVPQGSVSLCSRWLICNGFVTKSSTEVLSTGNWVVLSRDAATKARQQRQRKRDKTNLRYVTKTRQYKLKKVLWDLAPPTSYSVEQEPVWADDKSQNETLVFEHECHYHIA